MAENADADNWFGIKGEREGKPFLVRGRENLRDLIAKESNPRLLRILWEYAGDATGLPSRAATERMESFENAIIPELESDSLCVFFWVSVYDGAKEWLGYTSDAQETCNRINLALQDHERVPIQLSVQDDSGWQAYRTLIEDNEMR